MAYAELTEGDMEVNNMIWIKYFRDKCVIDYREFRDLNELVAWWRAQMKISPGTVILDLGNEADL